MSRGYDFLRSMNEAADMLSAAEVYRAAICAGMNHAYVNAAFERTRIRLTNLADTTAAQQTAGGYRNNPYSFVSSKDPSTKIGGTLQHDALQAAEAAARSDIENQYRVPVDQWELIQTITRRVTQQSLNASPRQMINEKIDEITSQEFNERDEIEEFYATALEPLNNEKAIIALNLAEAAGRRAILGNDRFNSGARNIYTEAERKQRNFISTDERLQFIAMRLYYAEMQERDKRTTLERARAEKITSFFLQHRQVLRGNLEASETADRATIKTECANENNEHVVEYIETIKRHTSQDWNHRLREISRGEMSVPAAEEYRRLMLAYCKEMGNRYHAKMQVIFLKLQGYINSPEINQSSPNHIKWLEIYNTQRLLVSALNTLSNKSVAIAHQLLPQFFLFITVKTMLENVSLIRTLPLLRDESNSCAIIDFISEPIFAYNNITPHLPLIPYPFLNFCDAEFRVFFPLLYNLLYRYDFFMAYCEQSCPDLWNCSEFKKSVSDNHQIIKEFCLHIFFENIGGDFNKQWFMDRFLELRLINMTDVPSQHKYEIIARNFASISYDHTKSLQSAACALFLARDSNAAASSPTALSEEVSSPNNMGP